MNDSCLTLLFDGDDEVLLGHEAVLCDIACEPSTQMRLRLKLIVQSPMMIVGVREYAINPPRHGAQSLDRVFLDRDTTREVLVAVEEGGGAVERVQGVVEGRALLRFLVSGTEKYPLFCGGHLYAHFRITLLL